MPLLSRARYKAAYGGRGGAKSHFFAEQLILRCYADQTRAVCIREVQNSIKDSVRQLLVDKIAKLGLGNSFEVLQDEIRGPRGSFIIFKGMQSYNADNIKSLEAFDIAWVEEAQNLSERSLRLLRPTIRKDGSELWFSWNPRHETDPVDKFFRGGNPPVDAVVCPVNWYDNPWFPKVLQDEKILDYQTDEEIAENVWGGGYERITAGSYFSKHIVALEKEGRVGYFPPLAEPVYTGWDLGVDDYTAIWFFQIHYPDHRPRVRIVDYFEFDGSGPDSIIPAAMPEYTDDKVKRTEALFEIDREEPFEYQRHFFPHDIGVREWGAGAKQRILSVSELGIPRAKMARGVPTDPEERINATRALLPLCEFHQTKRVMLGLTRLRRYSRKIHEQLGVYMGPLKDGNDHGADAFGEFAINCGIKATDIEPVKPKGKIAGVGDVNQVSLEDLWKARKKRNAGGRVS